MINEARVTKIGDSYLIVWHYYRNGDQKVHSFTPTYASKALTILEFLARNGYPIEPPDMVEQLKAVIEQEKENDRRS